MRKSRMLLKKVFLVLKRTAGDLVTCGVLATRRCPFTVAFLLSFYFARETQWDVFTCYAVVFLLCMFIVATINIFIGTMMFHLKKEDENGN